jgi:hypothetical protein
MIILVWAIVLLIQGFLFMTAWDIVVVDKFGGPELAYLEAILVWYVLKSIFYTEQKPNDNN